MKMPKASKNYGELLELLNSRGVDKDTCCGIILLLNTDAKYKKMVAWIKENPAATQPEIMRQHLAIANYVSYYPTKLRQAY